MTTMKGYNAKTWSRRLASRDNTQTFAAVHAWAARLALATHSWAPDRDTATRLLWATVGVLLYGAAVFT